MQASAEPNDCVKPNEQYRVYSNFAMASNRTFKNLGGRSAERPYCRASANFRASECRAELVRAMPSAAYLIKNAPTCLLITKRRKVTFFLRDFYV